MKNNKISLLKTKDGNYYIIGYLDKNRQLVGDSIYVDKENLDILQHLILLETTVNSEKI